MKKIILSLLLVASAYAQFSTGVPKHYIDAADSSKQDTLTLPLKIGNYIDTTTLDTLHISHKSVVSDSTNKITDQSINKTDIDTTSANIPFDGAFHVTTAVAESAYASLGAVTAGDNAQADTGITLTAGDGLTGGGNLQANRTFAVGAGTGISVSADAVSATLGTDVDSSEIVDGSVSGADLKADVLGNFIDTTQNDTIQNAHKSVLADSSTTTTTESVQDKAGALLGGTETGISVTYDDDNNDIDFVVTLGTSIDSSEVSDDNLALSDINWDFEWVYLTQVHGFNKVTEDSVYLNDFVIYGDTSYLAVDSCAGIVSTSSDTFSVVGSVPYGCIIDSLEMLLYTMGSTYIDSVNFFGPNKTNGLNLTDSSYWISTTNLSGALTIRKFSFANDITANAGDRFRFLLVVNFAADNDKIKIGWIRLRIKR